MEKVKKNSKGGVQKTKNKKSKDKVIPIDVKPPVAPPSGDVTSQSSVISVREAIDDAKRDNSDHKLKADVPRSAHSVSRTPLPSQNDAPSRPTSAAPERLLSAQSTMSTQHTQPAPGPSMRPPSGVQHREVKVEPSGDQIGSVASMQSKENTAHPLAPLQQETRPSSAVSKHSQDKSVVMGPAEMNEAHAYVPYLYARDTIAKITNDMKKMKVNHISIIGQIELNYKNIEDETQSQFNIFVLNLQQKYGTKVKTFRQVIEVHRMELHHKQEYWDEALQSLSQRNKQLLNEKRKLMIVNTQQYETLENEKDTTVRAITHTLSDKDREIADLKELLRTKERDYEEDKEKELRDMERVLREEWERDKLELEELRNKPISATVITETQSARPTSATATTDLTSITELERKLCERDAMILQYGIVISEKKTEQEKQNIIHEQEVKKLERELAKLRKKIKGDIEPDSDLEKQIEQLEDKVMQLELELKDTAADRTHFININKDQKVYLENVETQQASADTRVSHLLVAAGEGDQSRAELKEVTKQRDDLQDKIKALEELLARKSEELLDHDKKAEKLRSSMEKDMKRMLKEIAKLRKQIKEMPEPPPDPPKIEENTDKMEENIIDLEHQIATLMADKEYLTNKDQTQTLKIKELNHELYMAEKNAATLTAAAATRDSYQTQLAETQMNTDDSKQRIIELEQQLKDKERELRDTERKHEHALWEEESKQKEMASDIRKLLKQMVKLKKRLKAAEEATNTDVDVQSLQDNTQTLQDNVIVLEAERDDLMEKTEVEEARCADLTKRLMEAEEKVHKLQGAAGAQDTLVITQSKLEDMKRKVETHQEELRNKQKEIDERTAEVKDKDRQIHTLEVVHEGQLRDKEKHIKDLENEIRKLKRQMAKLREKLGISKDDTAGDLDKDVNDLEDKVTTLEKQIVDLEGENKLAIAEKDHLDHTNRELEALLSRQQVSAEIQESGAPLAMSTPLPTTDTDVQDLTQQISDLQKQVDQREAELREECTNHSMTKEELEIQTGQLAQLSLELENTKRESEAKLEATESQLNAEIEELKKRLAEAKDQVESLEAAQLANIPPDTAKLISDLRAKLKAKEEEKSTISKDNADLQAQIKILQAKIKSLEKSTKLEKTSNTGTETKLKQLMAEKNKEIQQVQGTADKKERQRADQERKKITALEQKIRVLEAGGVTLGGKAKSTVGQGDGKAPQALQDKLRDAKREISELKQKIRQLEGDRTRGVGVAAGGAGDIEAQRQMKKQEKVLKEMEKIIDIEKKKNQKNEANNKKLEQELKENQKALDNKEKELLGLTAEMTALGVSAKEAASLNKEIVALKSEMKKLTEDSKTLAENFNTERVLRKKYYNMVEDMKGKIRVYCRVRPMSKSELNRGNHSVVKSPDEYTLVVDSNRGQKEFQFDSIFMPESTQDTVFEDTNNLVQSAVDGYNVCIFAYGQTGSGKTFTIIGDREQNHPGIAPRAFNRIFELLQENKSKFSFKVTCYMLELYNDRLIDLFGKSGADEDKLDIKKDKKGMVVVQGAEIKPAKDAKKLNALFEEGSKTRHTASTNMNAESSRSHLVISIIIETTNRTSGNVMKGKLSLVDLAGSERAAKTGATAEQLREAMSINKSLSALGDVISALSSEQSFIPYRNNKLTMLMQDSLGGNAKTLMFVNVSPADYNTDETVVSLTYASRVKLITNDAQKNSDNKEIARLKNVIAKLKTGVAAGAEDED